MWACGQALRLRIKMIFGRPKENQGLRWGTMKKKLAKAKNIIDLGCGNNPVAGAGVGVDFFIDPRERSVGDGPPIDTARMKANGVAFVNARIDAPLPFKDKEFDFAYSHHVFEHLNDPAAACREMMRIAREGVIITPAFLAEYLFGRPYHQWLIMEREEKLFFFKKRPFEDRPFGEHPQFDKEQETYLIKENTNPFDMLLNDGGWYKGEKGDMPGLSSTLKKHWHAHSPLLEVVFLWKDKFEFTVVE